MELAKAKGSVRPENGSKAAIGINNKPEMKKDIDELRYINPKFNFLGTSLQFTFSTNNRDTLIEAELSTNGAFILTEGTLVVAEKVGVSEGRIEDALSSMKFKGFCSKAITDEFFYGKDLNPSKAYFNGDDDVEILFDCQKSRNGWSFVVVRHEGLSSYIAENKVIGETLVEPLSEDELAIITDGLKVKPRSSDERAGYLMDWSGYNE